MKIMFLPFRKLVIAPVYYKKSKLSKENYKPISVLPNTVFPLMSAEPQISSAR